MTPSTHILKLAMGITPSGIDLTTSVPNEWLCMQLVGALGIDVPRCTIERFEDLEVLAVERFDRRARPGGVSDADKPVVAAIEAEIARVCR